MSDVELDEAARKIVEYLKKHPGPHRPKDIALKLKLNDEAVFDAVRKLTSEGEITTVGCCMIELSRGAETSSQI